jgi:hypothetical protein
MGREKSLIKLLTILQNDTLKTSDCLWAITGGANHYIRRVSNYINDVDIITNFETGLNLASILKKYKIKDFQRAKSEAIDSIFGVFLLDELFIEIMADPINLIKNDWVKNDEWKKHIELIAFEGLNVPLTSLKYEIYIYSLLKNESKVNILKSFN